MRRPLPDGTTHLFFTGLELLRRVASLVPPPKLNLTRFHGVFAPGAKLRPFLLPQEGAEKASEAPQAAARQETRKERTARVDWAGLLRRTRGVEAQAAPAKRAKPCRAPEGSAARAGVYPKGLRGFSTRLAHCSGGPRQQPSSAPPVQSTTSQQAFNPSYACRAFSLNLRRASSTLNFQMKSVRVHVRSPSASRATPASLFLNFARHRSEQKA